MKVKFVPGSLVKADTLGGGAVFALADLPEDVYVRKNAPPASATALRCRDGFEIALSPDAMVYSYPDAELVTKS
jgi:hypothetical protein